jgi:hypothetical protein
MAKSERLKTRFSARARKRNPNDDDSAPCTALYRRFDFPERPFWVAESAPSARTFGRAQGAPSPGAPREALGDPAGFALRRNRYRAQRLFDRKFEPIRYDDKRHVEPTVRHVNRFLAEQMQSVEHAAS